MSIPFDITTATVVYSTAELGNDVTGVYLGPNNTLYRTTSVYANVNLYKYQLAAGYTDPTSGAETLNDYLVWTSNSITSTSPQTYQLFIDFDQTPPRAYVGANTAAGAVYELDDSVGTLTLYDQTSEIAGTDHGLMPQLNDYSYLYSTAGVTYYNYIMFPDDCAQNIPTTTCGNSAAAPNDGFGIDPTETTIVALDTSSPYNLVEYTMSTPGDLTTLSATGVTTPTGVTLPIELRTYDGINWTARRASSPYTHYHWTTGLYDISGGLTLVNSWTPPGNYAAAGLFPDDNVVYMWNAATGGPLYKYTYSGSTLTLQWASSGITVGSIWGVQMSPDQQYLYVGRSSTIERWKISDGGVATKLDTISGSLPQHFNRVGYDLYYSNTGGVIYKLSDDC